MEGLLPIVAQDTSAAAALSGHFKPLDWVVLVGYLALVSVLGVLLAGRQRDLKDFFRGGNRLPWYAVTGSIIATVISAVTFVAVPSRMFREGGNFTYLQLGLIAGLLSRAFVAFVLVPAYWKYRIYSPYDYMGRQLGESARTVTTALFSLLGLLAQAARVYLTAKILELVMYDHLLWLSDATGIGTLVWAVAIIGVIAVLWTMLGGIATVVWTDAMLFLVFVTGGIVALLVVGFKLPGGFEQMFSQGWEAGKFQLFALGASDDRWASDWGRFFGEPFTIWAAIFAVTFGNIGSYGTDQLTAQRIFTCRSKRDAQVAMLSSYAAEAVVALMLLVGVGLWAFYKANPQLLTGTAGQLITEDPDRIFPLFILRQVPQGLTGLIIAGIFAAAISSLTSILAALAQTTLSAVYMPLRKIDPEIGTDATHSRELIFVSRLLIVLWGAALCVVAFSVDRFLELQRAKGIDVPFLDLALGLANYVVGSLLAAFLLAWLPLRVNAWGLVFSAPLSVFTVYAAAFHDERTMWVCVGVGSVLLLAWILAALFGRAEERASRLNRTLWLMAGCGLMLLVWWKLWFTKIDPGTGLTLLDADEEVWKFTISWPWYAPLGGFVAFVFGYLLADRRERVAPPASQYHERRRCLRRGASGKMPERSVCLPSPGVVREWCSRRAPNCGTALRTTCAMPP
jgi:Na+/proline symporter